MKLAHITLTMLLPCVASGCVLDATTGDETEETLDTAEEALRDCEIDPQACKPPPPSPAADLTPVPYWPLGGFCYITGSGYGENQSELRLRVKNLSTTTTAPSSRVGYRTLWGTGFAWTPALAPGASHVVSIWVWPSYDADFTVTADDTFLVTESNEANNVKSFTCDIY